MLPSGEYGGGGGIYGEHVPGSNLATCDGSTNHACILGSCNSILYMFPVISMNKASGGDGIPVELFQIWKDDAVKVLHQYVSKCGKLSSGHRTGKGQFSLKSQRKANLKAFYSSSMKNAIGNLI